MSPSARAASPDSESKISSDESEPTIRIKRKPTITRRRTDTIIVTRIECPCQLRWDSKVDMRLDDLPEVPSCYVILEMIFFESFYLFYSSDEREKFDSI